MEKSKHYTNEWGHKIWYLPSKGKGYWHRLDGPAAEWADGIKEWWVDDKRFDSEEVKIWLEKNKIDLSTSEGQMAFKLRFNNG